MARPTRTEIDEQANRAADAIEKGRSRYPGMTFEEGVDETIRWMRGDQADPPIPDED